MANNEASVLLELAFPTKWLSETVWLPNREVSVLSADELTFKVFMEFSSYSHWLLESLAIGD